MQNLLVEHLRKKSAAQALWGIMDFQNMVEHLAMFYQMASSTLPIKFTGDESKIEAIKRIIIHSARPMPKGIKSPLLPEDKTIDHLFESVDEALNHLDNCINNFNQYWLQNADSKLMHPTLGLLNKHEWQVLQQKHTDYHLNQFNISTKL